MTVRLPVRRCCRMSPTITANGVISMRSRLTLTMCLTHFVFNTLQLPFPAAIARWHEMGCNVNRRTSVRKSECYHASDEEMDPAAGGRVHVQRGGAGPGDL